MGNCIIISMDNILGVEGELILSEDTIDRIHARGYFILAQVIFGWRGLFPIWLDADEIGLTGNCVEEWSRYIVPIPCRTMPELGWRLHHMGWKIERQLGCCSRYI